MSQIISYRPLKSVCGSEHSLTELGDRDHDQEYDSSSSLRELNSSLYRYVTLYGVGQQNETFAEEEDLTTTKNKDNSNFNITQSEDK